MREGILISVWLCCVCTFSFADNVKIENPWVQAVPPIADATAAYMKITNPGSAPLKLIGASSPIATRIEPMITTRQERNGQEIMGMESVSNLEIPGNGVLVLKPGGNHLMIMGLRSHPKEGERVKLTLRFAPGDQKLDVEFPVLKHEPQ
jgi:periplasmic copper chaperone A